MVPEAPLEQTDAGLVPAGHGWFVVNARDARWISREGRGMNVPLTGWTEHEAETYFPQLGVAIVVLEPGEPIGMYHWEADQEDFLILDGEALLIVEGEERPLARWDFVHCPPRTEHMIVGAGEGRLHRACDGRPRSIRPARTGAPTRSNEVALRHGVGVEEETNDPAVAYARFAKSEAMPYRDGALPG